MNKPFAIALVGVTLLSSAPAFAQSPYRDSDRDGRSDAAEWNRDRDRDGRPDQYDRNNNRRGAEHQQRWRYYGGNYGYNGYRGHYRTGQRFTHYRDRGYYISDYRRYGLPAPRPGYRYYRADNGDIVMAAIASGIIGLIVGGALNN